MTDERDDIWLDARERGESVDHIDANRRARYQRLEKRIAGLPPEAPPLGWQERVLARVRDPAAAPIRTPEGSIPPATKRRSRTPWLVASTACAAAAIAILVWRWSSTSSTVALDASMWSMTRRDSDMKVLAGDDVLLKTSTLVLRATSDRVVEMRVYDEHGVMVAHCDRCDADDAIVLPLGPFHHVDIYAFGCRPSASRGMARDLHDAQAAGCPAALVASRRVE